VIVPHCKFVVYCAITCARLHNNHITNPITSFAMLSTTALVAIIIGSFTGFACLCFLATELADYIHASVRQHGDVSYVQIDGYSECEKGCIESVAFLGTSEKLGEKRIDSVTLLDTEEKKSGNGATHGKFIFRDDRFIKRSESYEAEDVEEFGDAVSDDITPLIELLPAYDDFVRKPEAPMACSEEWISSQKTVVHKKRSTRVSELKDSGSMGTKGIRVVREDGEIHDEEEY
jgi:hypothetical protein